MANERDRPDSKSPRQTEKDRQFEALWEGRVPRGVSVIKRQRFRNWIKAKLDQRKVHFNKENAKAYWNGAYSEIAPDQLLG